MRLDALAFAQWLSSPATGWNTLTLAASHLEHGRGFIGGGCYGLAFTARIVLALDACAVDACIRANPNKQHLAVIGNAALATVFRFDGKARPAGLLSSRNGAIRSIGAAGLILASELTGTCLGFRDCGAVLVAGGITPSDATWMMGLRLKEVVHQRYRLEHGLKNEAARLRYVEKNPQAAIGGLHNAAAECRMLQSRLDGYTGRYAKLLPELEGMLSELAADWPDGGLTDEQMHWLDNIFVDTAEFRHGLRRN